MAIFAKTKSYSLHQANIPIFPLRCLNRLVWHIDERPFDGIALHRNFLWIDVVDLFVLHPNEQIPLPQTNQEHAFFIGVINVPGIRRSIIKFYDAELNGLPSGFFGSAGLGSDEASQRKQKKSAKGNAEKFLPSISCSMQAFRSQSLSFHEKRLFVPAQSRVAW